MPEGWLVIAACDTVTITDGVTTPITEGAPVTIVPTGNLRAIKSITLMDVVPAPTGAIEGRFSVSATQKVYFSQGNLQYIGSAATPYWQFAEHQWNVLGNNGQGSASETADRDLFGWGTSGYNHGATAYQPWSTSETYSHYYAYGNSSYNLYDQTGQADWGYNAIANGGNQENSGWRTLSNDEWSYLFYTRTDASAKLAWGRVNSIVGLIILPDDWTLPNGLTFTPGSNNEYTLEQWAQMESGGAVFLPSAGYRYGTSFDGSYINYWTSSYADQYNAITISFVGTDVSGLLSNSNRKLGYSVRLVRNAE